MTDGGARTGRGRNHRGEVRVRCYQYAGESASGPRMRLAHRQTGAVLRWKLSKVQLLEDAWYTASEPFPAAALRRGKQT